MSARDELFLFSSVDDIVHPQRNIDVHLQIMAPYPFLEQEWLTKKVTSPHHIGTMTGDGGGRGRHVCLLVMRVGVYYIIDIREKESRKKW